MDKFYGVVLTLLSGFFFLIGGFISLKAKDKKKIVNLSVSVSLVIMINLIFFDLIPEIRELLEDSFNTKNIIIVVVSTLLGFFILKLLDLFVPTHHHKHHDNEKNQEEHESHIKHIGTLTVISLIIHNILEGFAIFGITINDFKIGLLTSISVALHNIPLGMQIFSSMDVLSNKIIIFFLSLSSLLGGLIFLVIGNIGNLVLASITSITLGMILYIALAELLPEVIVNMKKRETIWGLGIGLILLIISIFI